MEQLGLGYDDLRAANPTLVYCEISGFGSIGPLAQKGGNDLISQAYSGLLGFTGEHGGGLVRCPISISDVGAALYATIGIVSALLLRERTGVGQKVDTSLLEGLIGLMGIHFVQYLMTGFIPAPMGTQTSSDNRTRCSRWRTAGLLCRQSTTRCGRHFVAAWTTSN